MTSRVPQVLVVEEDKSVTTMLRFALHMAGLDVVEAPTAAEALRALEDSPADALIVDLSRGDGPDAAVLDQLRHLDGEDCAAWLVVWNMRK